MWGSGSVLKLKSSPTRVHHHPWEAGPLGCSVEQRWQPTLMSLQETLHPGRPCSPWGHVSSLPPLDPALCVRSLAGTITHHHKDAEAGSVAPILEMGALSHREVPFLTHPHPLAV